MACQKVLGTDGSLAVTVSVKWRKGVLVIGSKVVEPILSNVVVVEGLERVRILACVRVITFGRLEAVVLCSLYAVDALTLGEIARRLLGLLDKWIGRRRIRSGCIGRNRMLQDGRKRRSRNGGFASSGEHVWVGEADTVLFVTGVERIREGLTITEGVFSRYSLSHGCEVDRLIEYDILTDSNFTVSTISIHLNVLVCFGKDSSVRVTNEMSLEGTRCIDFAVTVIEGNIDPAATPERVKLADVDVPPRNQVIGRVTTSRVIVEGVCITRVFHCETPVAAGNGGVRVQHRYVCLDSYDTNRALCDTVRRSSGLNAIAEGRGSLFKRLGAVVVLRVKSKEPISVLVALLPGRV
jgi:hypothetical protein